MIRYLQLSLTNLVVALEALTALTIENEPVDVFSTPPQLDGDLVTLTLLPRSRWQALLNLEVIQVRVVHTYLVKIVLRPFECSNGINRRNHRKSLNRRPSSFRLCLGLNIGLQLTRNKTKPSKRPEWTKPCQHPKVNYIKCSQNYRKRVNVGIAHILTSAVFTTFSS